VAACAGEYVVAEKLVSEHEEKALLLASSGPRSTGSLHSMGTHDSSSSLDWTIDAVPGKVRAALVFLPCPSQAALFWALYRRCARQGAGHPVLSQAACFGAC
jgi:hypothetical protein